jgi:hypothetical protein
LLGKPAGPGDRCVGNPGGPGVVGAPCTCAVTRNPPSITTTAKITTSQDTFRFFIP